jgi:hypothetical protein
VGITNVQQRGDVDVIVMTRRIGKPSILVLYSSNTMKKVTESIARNPGDLSRALAAEMNKIGVEAIHMAEDYLVPGRPKPIKNATDAFSFLKGLTGTLNQMLSDATRIGMQKGALYSLGIDTCYAYTIDHSYGINGARILSPKGTNFGFFPPRVKTTMDSLPGKLIPFGEFVSLTEFNVTGR